MSLSTPPVSALSPVDPGQVDLRAADKRGDVLSVEGTVDFTSLDDVFEDIETISMLAKDGSNGNSTITLDINDVLDLADSGFAAFANGFDSKNAIRIDGTSGDVVNLGPDPGSWLLATGATGVPDGYTAYSHVTSGLLANTNEDAYLLIQTGITVNGIDTVAIGGAGDAGTIAGYNIIADFNTAVDKLSLSGTPFSAVDTSGFDGTDSTLTIAGQTVKSHSIADGIITFDDANSFGSALPLTSISNVAAVVQYLRANDIGAAGATVAFTALIGLVPHTFVYQQVGATPNATNDILIDLSNTTIPNLTTVIGSGAIDPIILDLDGNGMSFSSLAEGVSFDLDADGRADRVAWNTSNDGILALDVDGSGTIEDGGEIFTPDFAGGSYATGTEALASLDSNRDGVVDADDQRFGELLIWKDANADGIAQQDELSSLVDNGVASIDLKMVATGAEVDGQTVIAEGSFTRDDGTVGTYLEMALQAELGAGENGSDMLTVELMKLSTGDGIAIEDDLEKPSDGKPTDQPNVGLDFSTVDLGSLAADHGGDERAALPGEPNYLVQTETLLDEIMVGDGHAVRHAVVRKAIPGRPLFRARYPNGRFRASSREGGAVLALESLAVTDLLADFGADKGELLDLSALLESVFGSTGNDVGDVVPLQEKGDGTLQEDANGAAGGQPGTETVTEVASAPAFDAVKALFGDDNHANAAHHTG